MVIRAITTGSASPTTKPRWARALAFVLIGVATLSLVYAAREKPAHWDDVGVFWALVSVAWPSRQSGQQSRVWLTFSFIGIGLSLLMTVAGFLISESLRSEFVWLGSSLCLICLGCAVDAQRPAHDEIPVSRMLLSLATIAALAISLWLRLHRAA